MGKRMVGLAAALVWLLTGSVANGLTAPTVPAAIAVPAGNVPFLVGYAQGTQIYKCQLSNQAYSWTLTAPAAVLKNGSGQLIIWHYSGPSWRALDGSTVTGVPINSAPAPSATAIPWLLLDATTTVDRPTLGPTTFIQRINTVGGVAPATGCDAAHAGASTAVVYQADYWFFRAA